MPVEEGTVLRKLLTDRAVVRTQRSSACASCQAQGACKTLGGSEIAEVEALDPLGAKEGDQVEISLSETAFLKASLIIYLVPTVALVIGAIFGFDVAQTREFDGNLGALLFGLAAFGITLLATRVWARRHSNDRQYLPEIVRIIRRPQSPETPPEREAFNSPGKIA